MSRAAAGVACGLAVRMKPDSDEIEKHQILTDISVSMHTVVLHVNLLKFAVYHDKKR